MSNFDRFVVLSENVIDLRIKLENQVLELCKLTQQVEHRDRLKVEELLFLLNDAIKDLHDFEKKIVDMM